MAISLTDLDALLADPTVGAVHAAARTAIPGLPPAMQPTAANAARVDSVFNDDMRKSQGLPTLADVAKNNVTHPTMPTMNAAPLAAPEVSAAPTSIPSVASPMPTFTAPTKKESEAAGKREYAEGMPEVTAAPGTTDYYAQKLAQNDYEKAHPLGSDVSKNPGVWGKLEHGLSVAGNIAGNAVDPGLMATIPGTQLNRLANESRWTKGLGEAANNQEKQAEAQSWTKMVDVPGPNGEMEEIPERFAGTLGAADTRAAASERNTDVNASTRAADVAAQQAGANQRTGEQQAGANERAANVQAGENARNQLSNDTRKTIADLNRQFMGSFQPILGANGEVVGFYNSKNPQNQRGPEGEPVAAGAGEPGGAAPASPLASGTTASGARLQNTRANQFNTQYVNPANQAEQQYQRATEAVNAYNNNPQTGAAAMVLFAQHLGTTLGGIKGAAIGEGAQQMHQNAIGLADRASRYIDYLKTGQPLSANQVRDFYNLIQQTRQLQWETTAREASRRQVPIDFLPADVQVHMTSPDGKEKVEVPGNRVQEFVDKGGKIGY